MLPELKVGSHSQRLPQLTICEPDKRCVTSKANMVNDGQIHAASDFMEKASGLLNEMKTSHKPVLLTLDGKAEFVIQDIESSQQTQARLDKLAVIAAVRESVESLQRLGAAPARVAMEELRDKLGISR